MEDKEALKNDSLDICSSNFNCEAYMGDLLRKKSLNELVEVEEDMVHNVRRLDSEMQQLVYENYNKFLTATSTMKKMQDDFLQMSNKMENLSLRIDKIARLSGDLSAVFSKHRSNVSHLSSANQKVKSLLILLSLTQKLQALFEEKNYEQVVTLYQEVQPTLTRYKNIPSICDIYNETMVIMKAVENELKEIVSGHNISSEKLSEAIIFLLKLNVPSSDIHAYFLSNCRNNLYDQLSKMQMEEKVDSDVLEFVDDCCSTFLTDLSLYTALSQRFFSYQEAIHDIIELVDSLMNKFEEVVRKRFLKETDTAECAIVVRALDRFYRRMSSCNQLISGMDYLPMCVSMLSVVSRHEIELARTLVIERFSSSLKQVQDELTTFKDSLMNASSITVLISRLEHSLLVQIKTALATLLLFTASDVTFSSLDQAQFSFGFGINVHELLVVRSLEEVSQLGLKFCDSVNHSASSPLIYVVLAQFFINVENQSVAYIMDLCKEQFRLVGEQEKQETSQFCSVEKLRVRLRTTAYELLKHFVYLQGITISQVLVQSIECCDWLNCAQPTSVRSSIKQFVDDVAAIDSVIKPFMGEGMRKERFLDTGSSRSHSRRTFDTGSVSSTLEKLWSERIDFCTNVEFNRISILTAIENIVLKSFLETVRLQTFSKFGLQQIQVDCYFLQLNLWRSLSDEQAAFSLIDEIVSSAVCRSVDAKLLESSSLEALSTG
ncbi:unnamed protein product [Thelazia callipaeda]|uniref:Vacuolar protein sorting-associated protein 51 homolog n=1 Tax=Thelazia callipaeda TaxID=103827 RepID=A0A0N5CJ69_THECL|nr:unnamed protein product [Thelazia callipaeda]